MQEPRGFTERELGVFQRVRDGAESATKRDAHTPLLVAPSVPLGTLRMTPYSRLVFCIYPDYDKATVPKLLFRKFRRALCSVLSETKSCALRSQFFVCRRLGREAGKVLFLSVAKEPEARGQLHVAPSRRTVNAVHNV